jgi:glycolate oxidase FAD binding subunit
MADHHQFLADCIASAFSEGRQIFIQGQQSKSFLTHEQQGETLSTLEHNGIITYEPSELVVTVRSGTRIDELQLVLAEHQQTLAFDPPGFDNTGTIGGAVATGLSGPSRPWTGAARDFILGCRVVNGKGEALKFGGQVMKNVAGYDASRLMVGAYGTLGLLLDISLKVLPIPEATETLRLDLSADEAIKQVNRMSARSLPISGACWMNDSLYLRISGSAAGISAARNAIGGETLDDAEFWQSIRDH